MIVYANLDFSVMEQQFVQSAIILVLLVPNTQFVTYATPLQDNLKPEVFAFVRINFMIMVFSPLAPHASILVQPAVTD